LALEDARLTGFDLDLQIHIEGVHVFGPEVVQALSKALHPKERVIQVDLLLDQDIE
jgi:hypothetical protein